jgi:hypothetical protein
MAREKHVHNPVGACHTPGKRCYESKKAAKRQIARMRKAEDRGLIQAYRCDSCGRWHVGHKIGSSLKRKT